MTCLAIPGLGALLRPWPATHAFAWGAVAGPRGAAVRGLTAGIMRAAPAGWPAVRGPAYGHDGHGYRGYGYAPAAGVVAPGLKWSSQHL
jgi:hypothetical protein